MMSRASLPLPAGDQLRPGVVQRERRQERAAAGLRKRRCSARGAEGSRSGGGKRRCRSSRLQCAVGHRHALRARGSGARSQGQRRAQRRSPSKRVTWSRRGSSCSGSNRCNPISASSRPRHAPSRPRSATARRSSITGAPRSFSIAARSRRPRSIRCRRATTAPRARSIRRRSRCRWRRKRAETPRCVRRSTASSRDKRKSVGEMVTMMPPTIVLVVQDVSVLELKVRLPERALRNVSAGSELTASFPALGVDRVTRVKRINPAIDIATRTVEIVADVDNSDGTLKPGMLADVRLGNAERRARQHPVPATPERKPRRPTRPRAALREKRREARRRLDPAPGLRGHVDRGDGGVRRARLSAHRRRPVPERRVSGRHRHRRLSGRRPGDDGEQGRRSDRGEDQHAGRHQDRCARSTSRACRRSIVQFELEVPIDQAMQDIRDKMSRASQRELPPGIEPPTIQKLRRRRRADHGGRAQRHRSVRASSPSSPTRSSRSASSASPASAASTWSAAGSARSRFRSTPPSSPGSNLSVDDVVERDPHAEHRSAGRQLRARRHGAHGQDQGRGEDRRRGRADPDPEPVGHADPRARRREGRRRRRGRARARRSSTANRRSRWWSASSRAPTPSRSPKRCARPSSRSCSRAIEKAGATLVVPTDNSVFIEHSIHDVQFDLMFGAFLAVVIILLFLRDLRATLISAVAIPTSVIATFAFMRAGWASRSTT